MTLYLVQGEYSPHSQCNSGDASLLSDVVKEKYYGNEEKGRSGKDRSSYEEESNEEEVGSLFSWLPGPLSRQLVPSGVDSECGCIRHTHAVKAPPYGWASRCNSDLGASL